MQAEAIGGRRAAEDRLAVTERQLRELEAKFEDEGREFADMDTFRRRLAEVMVAERDQYQKDLAERDFTFDQTRKKYQGIFIMYLLVPSSLAYGYDSSQLNSPN
jgi:myosin protein heavy chain